MGDARPSLLVEEGWVCGFGRLSFIGRWRRRDDLATLRNRGGAEGDASRDCLKALSAQRRMVWWFDLWRMVVVSCEGDRGGEGDDLGATTKWRSFVTGEGDLQFAVMDEEGRDRRWCGLLLRRWEEEREEGRWSLWCKHMCGRRSNPLQWSVFFFISFFVVILWERVFSPLCCELCVLLNKGIEKDFKYGQREWQGDMWRVGEGRVGNVR